MLSIAGLLVGLGVLQSPRTWLDAAAFAATNLVAISPVILIGAVLVAYANATGAANLIATAFAGRPVRMIVLASGIGALTPVCGITVLPLVAGLLGAGVPLAPIMAFWLSSPITDPGMLAITAATLGIPFAIAKTVAAFAIGLFGGGITYGVVAAGGLRNPVKPNAVTSGACGAGAGTDVHWRFWTMAARRTEFRTSAIGAVKLMLPWLAAAFVAEFFMKAWLPDDVVAGLVGSGERWAVPLATIVGAPIYLDGYAALPLVRGLIDSGMDPAAALSFLIAGGITSAWAIVPVFALVRLPVVCLYATLAVLGAMLAGWAATPLLG
ncbi:permease [Microbaculum marinum]|uniref:Permease n=1 Tax=Microbaculum marinum TaxID=1764581 RepID=A0AAW9RT58_9HYPH